MRYIFAVRKPLSILLTSLVFLNACSTSRVVMKHFPEPNQKIRVAVLPFKDAPNAPGSGEAASQVMMAELLKIPSYEIIERGAMDQLLKEQSLSTLGAIDPQSAANIGKILGADSLVVGAVTEYQERQDMIFPPAKAALTARLVRAESGTIDWSGESAAGWHPLKWVSAVFWPLGIFWLVSSPSVQDRLSKASRSLASDVASQTAAPLRSPK